MRFARAITLRLFKRGHEPKAGEECTSRWDGWPCCLARDHGKLHVAFYEGKHEIRICAMWEDDQEEGEIE